MKAWNDEHFLDGGGNLIRVDFDREPMSPRDWDNGTHFYLFNAESPDTMRLWRGTGLHDVNPSMADVIEDVTGGCWIDAIHEEWCERDYDDDWEWAWVAHLYDADLGDDTNCIDLIAKLIDEQEGYWCIPVHESYGDGVIYMDFVGKEAMGTPDDLVYDLLKGDVVNYTNFMEGNVYEWRTYDKDGICIDGCGGYYPEEPDGPFDTDWIDGEVHECGYTSLSEYMDVMEEYPEKLVRNRIEPLVHRELTGLEVARVAYILYDFESRMRAHIYHLKNTLGNNHSIKAAA